MLRRLLLSAFLCTGLCTGLVLGAASQAQAKGPTDARITGPGLSRPLVVTDRLPDLMESTGARALMFSAPSGLEFDRKAPTAALGPRFELRFAMGEQPVLEQHVYLSAPGGPAVYTPGGQHNIFLDRDMEGGWHRPDASIRRLFDEFGVPGSAAAGLPAAAPPAAAGGSGGSAAGRGPGTATVVGAVLFVGALTAAGALLWRARCRRYAALRPVGSREG